MADPFATALSALHGAAGSVEAVYISAGGGTAPIRVIRHQPSDVLAIGHGHAIADGSTLVVRREDVEQPVKGDQVYIGEETLTVLSDGLLDAEGVSWTVQAA